MQPITTRDEARIRRAIRYLVRQSRTETGRSEVQYYFDLLNYLRPEVHQIVEDETTRTLAEMIGSD